MLNEKCGCGATTTVSMVPKGALFGTDVEGEREAILTWRETHVCPNRAPTPVKQQRGSAVDPSKRRFVLHRHRIDMATGRQAVPVYADDEVVHVGLKEGDDEGIHIWTRHEERERAEEPNGLFIVKATGDPWLGEQWAWCGLVQPPGTMLVLHVLRWVWPND